VKRRVGLADIVAAASTLVFCATLALLPRLLEASGTVTNCDDQIDLQNSLVDGGLVTVKCNNVNAPATIPITSTLVITQPTTIDGGGVITLDGQDTRRIIEASAPLTLVNLTLWRGNAPGDGGAVLASGPLILDRVTVLSNTAGNLGGGVLADIAIITASTFLSNFAVNDGGGLRAITATINDSIFQGNSAVNDGGGLRAITATINGSTFQGNSAVNDGGGLRAGSAAINGSTFRSNAASIGGGLAATSVTVAGSTFLSNTAGNEGGGLYADSAVISASTVQANFAGSDGGGLYAISSATISDSTFLSNTTDSNGGGLLADRATVTASSFLSNSAVINGGGLWAWSTAVITASTFQSNTASLYGGGLWSGNAAVTASTFLSNTAIRGGGLWATIAGVTASTFLSNTAIRGGGLHATSATVTASSFQSNTANTFGGGLWAGSSATITASTFLSNTAGSQGGAVRANGPLTVTNSTLHANTALTGSAIGNASASQPTRLAFSTLSANAPRALATSGGDLVIQASIAQDSIPVCAGSGARVLAGWNFLADNSCGAPYDHRDPLLGPLADNGGPTLTRALLVGSPAIDQASSCPATDQRGVSRPVGVACDVGAYEYGAAPTLTALQPASALQGGPAFTLIVTGTTFLSGTVALWNGSVRPTTVLNSTTLSVAIPAGDLSMAGTMTVTARYGQAADSVSNGLPFSVLTPTPTPSPTPTPTLTPTPTPQPTNGTRLLLPLISLNQRAE
jgi:predicted outer membrane repeat protein